MHKKNMIVEIEALDDAVAMGYLQLNNDSSAAWNQGLISMVSVFCYRAPKTLSWFRLLTCF